MVNKPEKQTALCFSGLAKFTTKTRNINAACQLKKRRAENELEVNININLHFLFADANCSGTAFNGNARPIPARTDC
jgi:hypothetical protein